MMRIYAHYHRPEAYPEYEKRPLKVTTRKVLDDKIQFMSLRGLPQDENRHLRLINEALDLYTKRYDLGKVFWMNCDTLKAENLDEFVDAVIAHDGYVFDIWGFVPGSYSPTEAWGEYSVSDEVYHQLRERLGDRFIGFDNGEQDGRYIGGYTRTQNPAVQDSAFQLRRFYDHFNTMAGQLRHDTTALCSLNYGHFFARENDCLMLGAETAQALPNANLWYAYLRGAGKQYGLLWFGNASVFNRGSWKTYDIQSPDDGKKDYQGYAYGPDRGTSLSLLRRLMYVEYLYNSDMLGFESGLISTRDRMATVRAGGTLQPNQTKSDKSLFVDEDAVLTPIGDIQQDCARFIASRGKAGPMHTPVAVLLSADNGWTMPRHLYTGDVYRSWGQMPYAEGDHQMHALFTLLYPGYEDSGFFHNERGFLTPTPYGETADVLTADVRAEILKGYNLVVLAGAHRPDAELADKLASFVSGGGTLLTFAAQVADCEPLRALCGVKTDGKGQKRGPTSVCYDGRTLDEPELSVCPAVIGTDAKVIARLSDGTPFAVCRRSGQGRVVTILSPYGLTAPLGTPATENKMDESIPLRHDLTASVKAIVGDLLNEQTLVCVDNPRLEWLVNIRDERTLTVTVVNNGWVWERYSLALKAGREIGRREIAVPDVSHTERGYWPAGMSPADGKPSDDGQWIGPGQMAMWDIEFEPEGVEYAPEIDLPDLRRNVYASLRPKGSLLTYLLTVPQIGHYFAGVKLDADVLDDQDADALREAGDWLRRRGLGVVVDFSVFMDHYPHMSLIRNMPDKMARKMVWMEGLMKKAAALGAKDVLLTTHRNAENHVSIEQCVSDMRQTLRELGDMARRYGMRSILTNGVPSAIGADEVALAKACPDETLGLSLSHCLMRGAWPAEEAMGRAKALLIGAPLVDEWGQAIDARVPAYRSDRAGEIAQWLKSVDSSKYDIICLDGIYEDFGDLYLDRKALGKALFGE